MARPPVIDLGSAKNALFDSGKWSSVHLFVLGEIGSNHNIPAGQCPRNGRGNGQYRAVTPRLSGHMRRKSTLLLLIGCSRAVAQLSSPIADNSHVSVDGNRFLERSADPARTEWP